MIDPGDQITTWLDSSPICATRPAEGTMSQVQADPKVIEVYLGESAC
ncbi:hypothetical protein [Aeromonas sp. QDB56]|nr:hypothetical protein [Aeromonas sp. QDB56]